VIPTRLIAFDEAVNTTLGLPFIRTHRTRSRHGVSIGGSRLGQGREHGGRPAGRSRVAAVASIPALTFSG